MTEDSTHMAEPAGDPARRGGTIGSGLVPEEAVEGEAETRAAAGQPAGGGAEGLVEPGGVDAGDLAAEVSDGR